jgi:hypothetical protein
MEGVYGIYVTEERMRGMWRKDRYALILHWSAAKGREEFPGISG